MAGGVTLSAGLIGRVALLPVADAVGVDVLDVSEVVMLTDGDPDPVTPPVLEQV